MTAIKFSKTIFCHDSPPLFNDVFYVQPLIANKGLFINGIIMINKIK